MNRVYKRQATARSGHVLFGAPSNLSSPAAPMPCLVPDGDYIVLFVPKANGCATMAEATDLYRQYAAAALDIEMAHRSLRQSVDSAEPVFPGDLDTIAKARQDMHEAVLGLRRLATTIALAEQERGDG